MGLKHLERIEKFLKEDKNRAFSVSIIAYGTKINYNTVEATVEYLLKEKKIIEVKKGRGTIKYMWDGE